MEPTTTESKEQVDNTQYYFCQGTPPKSPSDDFIADHRRVRRGTLRRMGKHLMHGLDTVFSVSDDEDRKVVFSSPVNKLKQWGEAKFVSDVMRATINGEWFKAMRFYKLDDFTIPLMAQALVESDMLNSCDLANLVLIPSEVLLTDAVTQKIDFTIQTQLPILTFLCTIGLPGCRFSTRRTRHLLYKMLFPAIPWTDI